MASIGIFDSGSGGLSVYRELVKLLPKERYIYFSDNAHCPYGEKTAEYIQERAHVITDILLGMGADIIVVACNTATAAAIACLREDYPEDLLLEREVELLPEERELLLCWVVLPPLERRDWPHISGAVSMAKASIREAAIVINLLIALKFLS